MILASFFANNIGSIVVAAVLVGIVGLVVFSMVRDKKAGKSLQCGCSCKDCKMHCEHAGK